MRMSEKYTIKSLLHISGTAKCLYFQEAVNFVQKIQFSPLTIVVHLFQPILVMG